MTVNFLRKSVSIIDSAPHHPSTKLVVRLCSPRAPCLHALEGQVRMSGNCDSASCVRAADNDDGKVARRLKESEHSVHFEADAPKATSKTASVVSK
jgi:hypothetical protein